ncbi:MAG TPA: hypothetical protein VN445_04610 [Rectinemataceae bacterium]|nr:hypothetical protein [Rectinemataceae bacterium]
MKRTVHAIAFALMVTLSLAAAGAAGTLAAYGNAAAKTDDSLTIEDMLLYAAQDEYFARAEYVAIMAKFGTARPFSNIKGAEENHLAWLNDAFAAYKLRFPKDEATNYVQVPAALLDAFKAGVQAEIDNIAMYDKFLASPLIQGSQYADLRTLFTNLKNGSMNHLNAFQRQVGKY